MSDSIVLLGKTYRTEKVGDCIRLRDIKSIHRNGYIRLKRKGKVYTATRTLLGLTDPEKLACHTCDNPWCLNIDHLYVGTPQSNMDDKVARGRATRSLNPEWRRNEILEADLAYGPTLGAKYLGLKAASQVCQSRKTFL